MDRQKPKIVFIVGHANWGKSRTLRALTEGRHQLRRTMIKDHEFFIRRMSNDDLPEDFKAWIKSLDPADQAYVIAALCPNFEEENAATQSILEHVRDKGYQLFFWVMERQYGTAAKVSASEIARLRRFGWVEVFAAAAPADERAREFETFISKVVLA